MFLFLIQCFFFWFICFWDGTFPGPNCPGPNLPLFGGGELGPGQLGPGAQLSGAQFATFWRRTVRPRTTGPQGPTVRGPICPICPNANGSFRVKFGFWALFDPFHILNHHIHDRYLQHLNAVGYCITLYLHDQKDNACRKKPRVGQANQGEVQY